MRQTLRHPDVEQLKQFHPLKDLSEDQLELLARSQVILHADKGEQILKRGDRTPESYLLLAGEVELKAQDGLQKRIQAGTDSARSPIAQLLPRRYTVTANSPIEFLRLDFQLLESLIETSQLLHRDSTLVVEQQSDPRQSDSDFGLPEESMLLEKLRSDLSTDTFVLPSLPDIAMRIGRAVNDESSNAERIARVVQTDPAMTAKIIRAANSAMYAVQQPVDTCTGAVMRLGFNTTHKLVLSYALREIFRARGPKMQQRVRSLWIHSTRVAALAFILARLTKKGLNPEHALLAGLVHDIGELAVLSYVEQIETLNLSDEQIQYAAEQLRSEAGGLILERWEFPEDFVRTAREAEDWHRDPGPKPDYCDLVIVAQLHSYVGTERMRNLPNLGELPCFAKLGLDELTPRQSLKILDSAQRQIDEAQSLLNV